MMIRNLLRKVEALWHHRAVKVIFIALLIVLAVRLKGERLTLGALIARIADLIADLNADRFGGDE